MSITQTETIENKIAMLKNDIAQLEWTVKKGMQKETMYGEDVCQFNQIISRRKHELALLEKSHNTANNPQ